MGTFPAVPVQMAPLLMAQKIVVDHVMLHIHPHVFVEMETSGHHQHHVAKEQIALGILAPGAAMEILLDQDANWMIKKEIHVEEG